MSKNNSQKFGGFNSKQDSESLSAREAFRTAKDRNGIARCQSPKEHPIKIADRNNSGQFVTEYKFTNVNGEQISIRKDNPVEYENTAGNQGPHYNAGITGTKLKQHHNYSNNTKK